MAVALYISCSHKKISTITTTDEYRIAYNVKIPDATKDNWEIISMNLDGSNKKNITNNDDVAWTYTTHNKKILFISDRDTCYRCFYLYECDAFGNEIKKISNLRLEDSWMSVRNKGNEIIVSGRLSNAIRFQLFTINTTNGSYKQITQDTGALHRDPCFSPDGKSVVFSYKKNKRDRSLFEELYLLDLKSGNMKQITEYPKDNVSAKDFGYKAGSARWHPTQNFITYVSKQDGKNSIFATKPEGGKPWKLIENDQSEGWHDWSPDGKWLVYNNSDIEETQYHITLMNWQTKVKTQLTDNTYKSQLGPVFVKR